MQDPAILTLPVKLYSDEAAEAVSSFLHGVNIQYDLKARLMRNRTIRRPARPTLYKAFTVERADDGALLLRRAFDVYDGRACRYFSAAEAASAVSRGMLQALGTSPKGRGDYFKTGEEIDGKFAACVAELLGGADASKMTKKYGAKTLQAAQGIPANPIIATRRTLIRQAIDDVHRDFSDKRAALQDETQRKIDQLKQATHAELSRLAAEEDAKVTALEEELSKTFGEKNQKN